jgi:hypothetical protein
MLTTPDQDAGMVPSAKAEAEAQQLANETNQHVTVREHVSDRLIASIKPKRTPQVPAMKNMSPLGLKSKKERSVDTPLSSIPSTPRSKADQAAEAKRLSKGVKVKKLEPTAKELTEASGKLKSKKAAKASSSSKPKAKSKSDGQPEGKSAECIRLALRKNGVTPQELNEFTGWRGAPWRWLYSNPKKNGWADRFGYKLEVLREGRVVHYRLTQR